MNIFIKYFWKDESIYVSEMEPENLKRDMLELFNAKHGWPFKYELAGYFKKNNFFIAKKRFDVFSLESIGYRWNDNFLVGNISENKYGGTLITFQIKPEFQLKFFALISGLALITAIGYQKPLIILIGMIFYILGILSKKRQLKPLI